MGDKQSLFLRETGKPQPAGPARFGPHIASACLLGLAAFFLVLPRTAAADAKAHPVIAGVASVVDADTLDIHGTRIRLTGVDAPEHGQQCLDPKSKFVRCGQISANALDAFINSNPVSCAVEDKDRYGRSLAECTVRGQSVQAWLVSNGYAVAYRSYSTKYVPEEQAARKAKAGIWADRFVYPWDWRKGDRLPGEKPTKAMLEGKFASR